MLKWVEDASPLTVDPGTKALAEVDTVAAKASTAKAFLMLDFIVVVAVVVESSGRCDTLKIGPMEESTNTYVSSVVKGSRTT